MAEGMFFTWEDLKKHDTHIRASALREAADEMEAEYERRTALSGAYGQMKIRAALRMGAGMNRLRADRIAKVGDRDYHPCGDYPAPCNCDDPETHGGH